MSVQAAFGVGINIEFNLANAGVQLLRNWGVLILETPVGIGVLRLPDLGLAGCNASVVAVVGPNYLNLIELELCFGSLRNGSKWRADNFRAESRE